MTLINREDHQARINAVKKLSAMSKLGRLPHDTGLCDTVKKDLKWRSKVLNEKLEFWEMVSADFPTPISEKICLRQDIGPLSQKATSLDFERQALSKHGQFSRASLVLSKLRAFDRTDGDPAHYLYANIIKLIMSLGFVLTFANTSGIDYLTRDFEQLIESPGYDMLYHHDVSVLAHAMHAFKYSGTKRWKRKCKDSAAVWLIVYLITEAAVTPNNIRGGRSAIEILDAYMDVRSPLSVLLAYHDMICVSKLHILKLCPITSKSHNLLYVMTTDIWTILGHEIVGE
ncbi:hypothetical protein RRF57_000596 [Xylaria bambusicola]|uniref:Uncharacterized protein n=1 Tax=Xylaria bambusicola TaxID=326684 RepID=A0AAN7U431_9PEZI